MQTHSIQLVKVLQLHSVSLCNYQVESFLEPKKNLWKPNILCKQALAANTTGPKNVAVGAFTLDANVSNLTLNQTYQIDIPEGFIVDSVGKEYAGTAYTFTATGPVGKLFAWGSNANGKLGLNSPVPAHKSSPVQVPGTGWTGIDGGGTPSGIGFMAFKNV